MHERTVGDTNPHRLLVENPDRDDRLDEYLLRKYLRNLRRIREEHTIEPYTDPKGRNRKRKKFTHDTKTRRAMQKEIDRIQRKIDKQYPRRKTIGL